jgi:glycine cleavage system transcriptional repressor
MQKWFMLSAVGEDRPGIVAKLTHALYEGGANLGEASMVRLGGMFTVMLTVGFDGSARDLDRLIEPVTESLDLHSHIDAIRGLLHAHTCPDVRITVSGADRAGMVARVTGALAEAGLNILDLESNVAGSAEQPLYVMRIEGRAAEGIEALRSALAAVAEQGIETVIEPIETMAG